MLSVMNDFWMLSNIWHLNIIAEGGGETDAMILTSLGQESENQN